MPARIRTYPGASAEALSTSTCHLVTLPTMTTETESRSSNHPGPRRPAGRPAPQGVGRHQALHPLRRPPVLDLRRLPRGGHRHRRHPPRAGRRVRRRGLGQGHARARRLRAHRRPGRDQRHERDRVRAGERVAGARARRPRAGDAVGDGVAPGDRPRAVRRAADQAGRDRRADRRRSRAWSTGRCEAALEPPTGPTFIDFPLDHVFMEGAAVGRAGRTARPAGARPPPTASSAAIELLKNAERPVIMAGTGPLLGARRGGAASASATSSTSPSS